MTESLGFHSQASANFQDFSKDLKKNLEAIEKIPLSSEAVLQALGEIKEFFEKNQQYISEARPLVAELLGRCRKLENEVTGGQISQEITDIAKKNLNFSSTPIGRTPDAGASVSPTISSTATQKRARTKKSVLLPKLTYIEGQKVAVPSKADVGPNYSKIDVHTMEGASVGRSYLVVNAPLREAAEASVFQAESNDGVKVAIRKINLRPLTLQQKKKGAQEMDAEADLKNTAKFEAAMKNTNDSRMDNLCLKSEVLIRYDKNNQAADALEIMPLAKMSLDRLVTGGMKKAFQKLSLKERSEVSKYVAHQLLHGLSLVHEQKWVHHDVKLDNLLLMHDGTIKLTDFGFTKESDATSKMKGDQMNPQFISPEVAANTKVREPTDMWSAGILIAELSGCTIPSVSHADLKNEGRNKEFTGKLLEELKEKSPEMVELVSEMLKFKPGERITANVALKEPVFKDLMSKEKFIQLINNLETK